MIKRDLQPYACELFLRYPVITITGPRQAGKTTLARQCFPGLPCVNLEAPDIRRFAAEDPRGFLAQFQQGVILDEIQRIPELPSYIQVLVDERGGNSHFVLTGSHQFEMMEQITQSLAGRTAVLQLLPFSLVELGQLRTSLSLDEMMTTGFMPRIHDQNQPPSQAHSDYVTTYVERDLRSQVAIRDLACFDRFLRLCAGRTGGLLNFSSLANDTGISHTTARQWVNLLEAGCILFRLQPYHRNIGKRLIKAPKLYFVDVGLASHLCGIHKPEHLAVHPLRGALFENMVVVEVLKYLRHHSLPAHLSFYRDSGGCEIDLLIEEGGRFLPIEIKSGATVASDFFRHFPVFTKSEPNQPFGAIVVYGGDTRQNRTGLKVIPIADLALELEMAFPRS